METGYQPRDYTVEEDVAVLDENAIDVEFTVVGDETDAKKPLAVKPAADVSDEIVALKA